jgi:hypothetical protein
MSKQEKDLLDACRRWGELHTGNPLVSNAVPMGDARREVERLSAELYGSSKKEQRP